MTIITAQRAPHSASNFAPTVEANAYGMNDRIKRLRQETFEAEPSLSIERALIETRFYKENYGKYPIPILRAMNFYEICKQKTIYIGKDELIVGERGPKPKCVPTFPELTCHSVEDLHVLNTRELQRYTISQEDIDTYEREVIPYWKGRTQRERIFSHVPQEWKEAYEVGMFTEFMEQRAPGHTALDGKVYKYGLLDLKERIRKELDGLDFMNDPEATDKQEELTAMSISCDAAILFAERHADLADEMSLTEKDPKRAAELRRIADRFAAKHHGNHDDQQHGRRAGIRCHDAEEFHGRHAGQGFEIQVVRVADRGEHTAHVRANGHQRDHEDGLILLPSHDEHGHRERHKRDQRNVIGDEHRGKERQSDKRNDQSAHGADLLQQSRTDDAEHADTLESAHHNHQADELADGAGVNVAFVIGVRRHNETRNQGEYCGDDENRLIFGYIDQPASHPFLRE